MASCGRASRPARCGSSVESRSLVRPTESSRSTGSNDLGGLAGDRRDRRRCDRDHAIAGLVEPSVAPLEASPSGRTEKCGVVRPRDLFVARQRDHAERAEPWRHRPTLRCVLPSAAGRSSSTDRRRRRTRTRTPAPAQEHAPSADCLDDCKGVAARSSHAAGYGLRLLRIWIAVT